MCTPPRPRSRRHAVLSGLGLAVLLLVPACRSAVDAKNTSDSVEPKHGGVVRIVQAADIAPNNVLAQNNVNLAFLRLVYNTLTEYDHATREPKPSLAESWQVSPDGTTLDLRLRQGVVFHSGRAFTADDVLFTLDFIRRDDVPSQLKHVAKGLAKAEKTGDHGVRLTFAKPVANVFDLFELMVIVDKDTADQIKSGKFVGTGPFKVDTYAPGSKITLSRNPSYWKQGQPYLDGVEIAIARQSQSMLSSLRAGQSQLALDLAPLDAAAVRGDLTYDVVVADTYDSAFYIGHNTQVAPLNDPRVRQAVAWAVDRSRILQQVLGGIGRTSSLPWAPGSPAFDEKKADTYRRDIGKARELLTQAGAMGVTIDVSYNAGLPTNAAIAEIVTYDLNEAGFTARTAPLQGPDFQAKLTGDGLPGLFVNNHGFGQLNPSTLVKGAFPFNADKNAARFVDADYKKLAESLWTTTDPAAQKDLYGRLNSFLLEKQFITDLVVSAHTFTINRKLEGLGYTMFGYVDLDAAHLR
ncbi:ABC transporter substrate-binding protein [Actinokineospora sp. HUAS TT18]|uniref:ABC transporter substrate-binding protein n=1 Tax=Actinokineospora sp. HUAS TT18 TaxID=3447451 RepID=UPI003F51B470